ncbi:MAG TPA: PEGA domain-containing protein [Fibrobacteria bacterium]|nr:PEGA domain-containing protein [Fibrobacteria bacterium]HOX51043.1 PEGA domain-containing protein [Fibrobacteria bacterium]
MKSIRPTTALVATLAFLLAAAPGFAQKKKGSKKVQETAQASQVEEAPSTGDTASPTTAYKGEALPPINPDDTAFEPSKGKPERGGKGQLVINTRPSGAEVYYADEYRGKTPITIDANSGRDDLSIDLDGWNLYKSRVNVWNGQTTTLNIELKLPLGNLQITTNPGKASISLDGRPIGSTQGAALNVAKVPAGKHNICGTGGGRSGCQSIEVPREETLKVHLNLK